jgi:anaerobic nitric oxide reductase flavorubredoxin
MKTEIKNDVYWVGKIDWELRKFHGDEYSTHRGSSYNSYLIQDEKTALIDTVWAPFDEEYVENLAAEIDLNEIDYVIINHAEVDHSGALPELMRRIPNVPIYCTANGVQSLTGLYHKDWNFNVVKTGDHLSLGNRELVFVEAPMLHWPDSMFCYLTEDHILFSTDAFGQHYATEFLYNDKVDQFELMAEALKYYANILTPFSKLVQKKIEEFLSLELPLDVICTSHGVIWRDNPAQIVEKYLEWSNDYQENQITIIYDTMWNGTKTLAEKIAEGLKSASPDVTVKLYNSAKTDKNDIVAEVFKSKAVVVGSPTINRGILTSIAALMEEIRGLGFRGKKAAAFGTYGWSGESAKQVTELLERSGFSVVGDGFRAKWNPNERAKREAIEYGQKLAVQFES